MLETMLSLDERIFLAINSEFGRPMLDEVFSALSNLGEGLPMAIILLCCAFIGSRQRVRARLWFMAIGVLAGAVVVHAVKLTVARPRPAMAFESRVKEGSVTVRLVGRQPRGPTSWPSGHAQGAFAAAIVLGELFRRLRWPLLAAAALIGLSRVYVGAHFPLDVLTGALIGVGTGLWAVRLWRRKLAREPLAATSAATTG